MMEYEYEASHKERGNILTNYFASIKYKGFQVGKFVFYFDAELKNMAPMREREITVR